MAKASTQQKNDALTHLIQLLNTKAKTILKANEKDIQVAKKNKLEYAGDINVKYHDTIDDIKSQNPDPQVPLSLIETNYNDVENNVFQYKKIVPQK